MRILMLRWIVTLLAVCGGPASYAADALLPMVDKVPPTQALAIDGIWTVSSLGKRIRVEKGRAYVVDPWRHLFVLKVRAGMVVVKDIQPQGPGVFGGYDLMAIGPWRASKNASGTLDVELGGLVPTRFQMLPVQLDNPDLYRQVPVAAPANPYAVPASPVPTGPAPAPTGQPAETYPAAPVPINGQPTPPVTSSQAPPAATPAAPPASGGGTTCREVVYQEATDDFRCVQ